MEPSQNAWHQERAFICKGEVWLPRLARRPLTFRLPLIGYHPTEVIANQLLASGLQWLWCCWWKEHEPWEYPLKLLRKETVSEFVVDALREEDMFLYFLDLYGWSPEIAVESDHQFAALHLSRFYEGRESALQMVIQRLDDEPAECTYISVPRSMLSEDISVQRLLGEWGIGERLSGFAVRRGESDVLRLAVRHYKRRYRDLPERPHDGGLLRRFIDGIQKRFLPGKGVSDQSRDT